MEKNTKRPSMLEQELKRYNNLLEYNYYSPREPVNEADPLPDAEAEPVTDEMPDEANTAPQEPTDPVAALPAPENSPEGAPAPTAPEIPPTEPQPSDIATPETAPEPEVTKGPNGEVEVDVSDLVKNSQESKDMITKFSQSLDGMLSKFQELETKLGTMDNMMTKIDSLESQVEKRMPTPVEKLELRSLSSYPYNVKLTDYWADKLKDQNGIEKDENFEPKVYNLTPEDIEGDYSEEMIKKSFKPNGTEEIGDVRFR